MHVHEAPDRRGVIAGVEEAKPVAHAGAAETLDLLAAIRYREVS